MKGVKLSRRDTLRVLGTTAVALATGSAVAGLREQRGPPMSPLPPAGRMPALFVAHGAPPLLEDAAWMAELRAWGQKLPRPKGILILSAHWAAHPAAIGATERVPLVYDFYGFPERYYRLQYASPGAPELAAQVRAALRERHLPFVDAPARGLDHGSYIPLMFLFPNADVPVLQMSLPGLDPKDLMAFGRALAPLRDQGILIIGSGFLTHNLRLGPMPTTPGWASEFDQWAAESIAGKDLDQLADFRNKAPAWNTAHPSVEHYAPILVSMAVARADEPVTFPIAGFWFGSFSKRSVQIG